jgi:hypothetical protein
MLKDSISETLTQIVVQIDEVKSETKTRINLFEKKNLRAVEEKVDLF